MFFLSLLSLIPAPLILPPVFRIGKPIDFYLEILKQLKNPDAVLRNTISGRAVCLAGWLLLDHLLWFGKIGVINIDMKKWSRRASWFWLTGLLLAVTRDVYQYLKVTEARQRYIQRALQQQPGEPFSVVLNSPAVHQFDKDRRTHIIELVKDVFDLSIPTSSLELLPLSPGLVGLLGLLSSLIGLKQVWPAPSAAK